MDRTEIKSKILAVAVVLFAIAAAAWAIGAVMNNPQIEPADNPAPTTTAIPITITQPPTASTASQLAVPDCADNMAVEWTESGTVCENAWDEAVTTTTFVSATTTATVTPGIVCSSPHKQPFLNGRGEWICRQLTAEQAGIDCDWREKPKWDIEDDLWKCQAPPTTTTRPPRPNCQKGYLTVWLHISEKYECRRPAQPECYPDYPEARWVQGAWECYQPCSDGYVERIDSSGTRWCYPLPDCGSSMAAIYVPESDRYVCSETEETASQFWEYAFHAMGIRGDSQKARWIGGLGMAYNKNLWREYMAVPGYDYEGGLEVWVYMNKASTEDQMGHIAAGASHVHICYEHDCDKAGNLIGSTDSSVSSCQAFVWHSEGGLWFLIRIDEFVPVCVRAFDKVSSGDINGASASHIGYDEDTGRTAPKDGVERPVYYSYDVELDEITLTQSSKNYAPVDNHTWVTAIDLRA